MEENVLFRNSIAYLYKSGKSNLLQKISLFTVHSAMRKGLDNAAVGDAKII